MEQSVQVLFQKEKKASKKRQKYVSRDSETYNDAKIPKQELELESIQEEVSEDGHDDEKLDDKRANTNRILHPFLLQSTAISQKTDREGLKAQ